MSKERAQRGDSPVAGVWQHRFHCSLAAGHLPAVNSRASSGMDAALAQGALEGLSESAAGLVGGSKPKVLGASALVASRDSEGGRRPTLHDAPHGLFKQTVLLLLWSVGSEQKCVRNVTPGQLLAQELVNIEVGDLGSKSRERTTSKRDDCDRSSSAAIASQVFVWLNAIDGRPLPQHSGRP